jgi:ABC-type glycerol-3-phosphate transport system permease component
MKIQFGRKLEDRLMVTIAYVILAILLIWSLFPFYWMLVTSVKPDAEMYRVKITLIPQTFTLEHYRKILFDSPFPVQFRNSLIVSVTTTLLSMILGSLAAYSITRLRYRGRAMFARSLIFGYLIPPTVLFIPLFALIVVALFSFTLSWNEFLYALVLTSQQYSRTATVGINSMLAEDVFFWGQMMAASVITAAPPVLMYFFSQKWVVSGLTLGGVKA